MNIAQPISSEIDFVEFRFLSPEEIQAISVKRIENDNTFDSLLQPVPGGLYDPALGSWGDSPYVLPHSGVFNSKRFTDLANSVARHAT